MFGNIIRARGVNDALPQGIKLLQDHGRIVTSRGMETVEVPGPVSTVYSNPLERVLFDADRDANPFFHLMESLWIIGGSNIVALPKYFMNSIDRFSDNGAIFHGAYGHRLRSSFGMDQLENAIDILRFKPDSRQAVMSIWDPVLDLAKLTRDLPCNDMVMLKVRDNRLNMTVCNRSNDAIWGAYGANVVQFSMLLEWLAASIGVDVGYYVQQSDSFHAYTDNPYWKLTNTNEHTDYFKLFANPYGGFLCTPFPIAHDQIEACTFQEDCEELCKRAEDGESLSIGEYRSRYFTYVVVPVIHAYDAYKRGDYAQANSYLMHCQATDWQCAMFQWVERRRLKVAAKDQA